MRIFLLLSFLFATAAWSEIDYIDSAAPVTAIYVTTPVRPVSEAPIRCSSGASGSYAPGRPTLLVRQPSGYVTVIPGQPSQKSTYIAPPRGRR